MRLANRADKNRVVTIISEAYRSNPSILWIIKNDAKIEKRIRILAEYCFEFGIVKKGLYLTQDNNGLCIVYDMNNHSNSFTLFLNTIRLAIFGITLPRLREILHRDKTVKKIRNTTDGYYGMLFASDPKNHSLRTAKEIQEFVFTMADKSNKTLYAETTVEKNKRVYEQYGFEVYQEWLSPKRNLKTYFIKRIPGVGMKRVKN